MLKRVTRYISKIVDLRFGRVSYSQEGEDLLLDRIFEYAPSGFYVDVGAHHPKRFSNTYIFYKRGWRGINVDAMPNSMQRFKEVRPHDINLELGISKTKQILTYHMFDEPALNSFDGKLSEERHNTTGYKIIGKKDIQTLPLSELLDTHLPPAVNISFMSIDVEGLDLEVLESNNWTKYRPAVILIEILHSTMEDIYESAVHKFLTEKNYGIYCKTPNTVMYRDTQLNTKAVKN